MSTPLIKELLNAYTIEDIQKVKELSKPLVDKSLSNENENSLSNENENSLSNENENSLSNKNENSLSNENENSLSMDPPFKMYRDLSIAFSVIIFIVLIGVILVKSKDVKGVKKSIIFITICVILLSICIWGAVINEYRRRVVE